MGPVSIGVEVQRNTDGDTPSNQGLSEPEFYGDLVNKFKKIVGRIDFADQFRKKIYATNVLAMI